MALVLDPRTGKLVDDGSDVPGNPARAAAMQAQFNQPVVGPRTVVPPAAPLSYPEIPEFNTPVTAPAATPVAPAAPTSAVNPNATNVGGALGRAYLGGMAAVPAVALDAVRRGATSLVGGDVNSLPGGPTALGDRAFGAVDQGLSQLGQANANLWGNVQAAGRNVLGVQAAPAAPGAATPRATAPAAAPEPTPAAPAPAPYNAYEDPNHPINRAPQGGSMQAPVQAPVRGDYNMTNTARGAGAPANNGINFGFGVNGAPTARETLDRFALQDVQNAMGRRANVINAEIQAIQSGLSNRSSVGELVAARQRIAALQPLAVLAMENTAGLADRAAQSASARQKQELANLGAVEAAQVAGQARTADAQTAAQGTVAAAQTRAQGLLAQELLRQQSPEQQRAASEAQLLDLQTQAVLELLASRAPAQDVVAATRRGQPQAPAPYVADPMGIPLYRVAPDGTIQLVDPADAARVRAIANPRAGQ